MGDDEKLSSPRVPVFDVAEVGPGNVSVSAFAAAICVNRSSSRRWRGRGRGRASVRRSGELLI